MVNPTTLPDYLYARGPVIIGPMSIEPVSVDDVYLEAAAREVFAHRDDAEHIARSLCLYQLFPVRRTELP